MIEFYANRNNWEDDNIELTDTEMRTEVYNGKTLNHFEGGKQARQYFKDKENKENRDGYDIYRYT